MPESIRMVKILKNKYLPFLFAVPLFFSVYHYGGIVVDAILYVTQYVYSVDPARFAGDPAFEFGNQGSLGFFSPIFGLFIESLGVVKGALVYTLLIQFAWVLCLVLMVKALLRLTGQRLWVLPVMVLLGVFLSSGMGFSHIRFFHFVSSYACSRSLSMTLGVAALALSFYQKRFLSLFFILAGTAVHPITAGWCLPFWMFYFFPKTRVPILVASLLFPFTFLLHTDVFDFFSNDWLARPLGYALDYEIVSRYTLLLVLEGALFKITINKQIRNISVSLFLLTVIALYWDAWGGYGEHIFLYFVQPWRALWIPSLILLPLGICNFKDVAKKLKKRKRISTHDFAMLLLIVSCLAPRNIILISIVAVVLIARENKPFSLKASVFAFVGALFAGFLVQQYHTWNLLGLDAFVGYNYQDVYCLRDSFLIYLLVFVAGFALYFLKRRKIVLTLLMVVAVFLSRFMLLPLLPLYLYFFPRKSGAKYWGGVALIVVMVAFDGMFDVETRRQTLFGGLPLCFPWVCFAMAASFTSIWLSKRLSYFGIAIWLSVCGVVAMMNYNTDCKKSLETEKQLDRYLHESVFPQVKERGRMLFYVSGAYVGEPRLQFMTGSYFTSSVNVGAVFSKGHYRTALERSHLLYQKDYALQSHEFFHYEEVVNKLADVDTLIDRVSFLCGIKEISHLVTDKTGLPFVVEDSTMVNGSQKTYLYGCNPAR